MKTKYKHKFDRLSVYNRWKDYTYNRNGTWVILGFGIRFFSTTEYEYYFSFLGLYLRFWFIRTPK